MIEKILNYWCPRRIGKTAWAVGRLHDKADCIVVCPTQMETIELRTKVIPCKRQLIMCVDELKRSTLGRTLRTVIFDDCLLNYKKEELLELVSMYAKYVVFIGTAADDFGGEL